MSAPSDKPTHAQLSHAELVHRVTELESRLAALNAKYNPPSPVPPTKKPKKPSKPFDASKYSTRLVALKFAYLGGNYNGLEHHANNTTPLPTVEEELWKALSKTKLIFPVGDGTREEGEVCWDGCEYSKCGRTDRGVSAFGQVVVLRMRSSRPKATAAPHICSVAADEHGAWSSDVDGGDNPMPDAEDAREHPSANSTWDPIRDELPYIQLLNRVLPPDIRVLAWCPSLAPSFSARFNCKERRYRYFFTNPAYLGSEASTQTREGEGWLNVVAMRNAAKKLEGLHDFRNFCKVDPSKQISNFERRIFHADVHRVEDGRLEDMAIPNGTARTLPLSHQAELYYFEVRGSAFLWHQVRHMVAILFLVGQGYEDPGIVDELLDVRNNPSKPMYEMASDVPLVLWDCIFPSEHEVGWVDHGSEKSGGYVDALEWVYVGDEVGGRGPAKQAVRGVDDGKWARNGMMDELWTLWRKRKMDEVLTSSLLGVVAELGSGRPGGAGLINGGHSSVVGGVVEESARVFDGSDRPRAVGKYMPVMQRERMEAPEVVNTRYAARKGLLGSRGDKGGDDLDE